MRSVPFEALMPSRSSATACSGRPWRIAMVASFRWALPLPGEIVSAFLSICDASLTRFMASSVLPSLVNAVELRGFKRSASLSSRSASRQSFRIIATDPRISWAAAMPGSSRSTACAWDAARIVSPR